MTGLTRSGSLDWRNAQVDAALQRMVRALSFSASKINSVAQVLKVAQYEDQAVAARRSVLWAVAETSFIVAERWLPPLGAKLGAILCGRGWTAVDSCGIGSS